MKYEKGNSKFARHLIKNKHAICLMDEIMNILHITKKKGEMMDTLEKFYIYNKTKF
jgi:hypothetical protein